MNPLVSDLIHLLAGILCAWLGGELFVRGLVGFGFWARIPGAVVGVTVAALATSSPEISVAVKSSLHGVPAISMGDVLGSNVANIGLVLAITLLVAPHRASLPRVRRDLICAAATPGGDRCVGHGWPSLAHRRCDPARGVSDLAHPQSDVLAHGAVR